MVKHRKPFTAILVEEFKSTSLQLQYMIMTAAVVAALVSFHRMITMLSVYIIIYFCFSTIKYYKIYLPMKNMAFREKNIVAGGSILPTEDYLLWAAWEAYTIYWSKHPEISDEYSKDRLCAIIGVSFGVLM